MGMGRTTRGFADGGVDDMMGHNGGPPMEDEYTPIVVAGGEAIVDPEYVVALGSGSETMGKKILSDEVVNIRKQMIQHLKTLPRPAR